MPTYVYRIVRPGVPVDQCETFELHQSIHEAARYMGWESYYHPGGDE